MMAFPGWTWEYIDEWMTLPRLYAIFKYWGESRPPVHWMVAGFLGVKRKPSAQDGQSDPDAGDVRALAESMMSGPLLDG